MEMEGQVVALHRIMCSVLCCKPSRYSKYTEQLHIVQSILQDTASVVSVVYSSVVLQTQGLSLFSIVLRVRYFFYLLHASAQLTHEEEKTLLVYVFNFFLLLSMCRLNEFLFELHRFIFEKSSFASLYPLQKLRPRYMWTCETGIVCKE